jgi:hypothetical protein
VQCEVTYVNHLEQGREWKAAVDWPSMFRCWINPEWKFLPDPQSVAFRASYPVAGTDGRLLVSAQPAIRDIDGKEIVQLTLTARGKPAASDWASAINWIDTGRDWVVRGFTDLTTKQMHDLWRREI